MRKGLTSRTAQKLQRYQIKKAQQNMSSVSTKFRTHDISKSNAQIILPQHYKLSTRNDDLIYLVTVGRASFYAEISDNTFDDKSSKDISVLQNLVAYAGIALDSSGCFTGELKCLEKSDAMATEELEFVEIVVKSIYLSRRDQYKVLENLRSRKVHVYDRKVLHFDKLGLEVTNLMRSNNEIRKTGLITAKTKIIFRSGCAKYTILVQISKQMFQLSEEKQLYLQKTKRFLLVFLNRNKYFNNNHRIEIILFARLYYPQFSTLKQAYKCLQTDESIKGNVFTINYAVALQKDCHGRIYQDAYQRLLWPSESIGGFRERFWERVSKFIFTINWSGSESYAQYISKSVEENIEMENFSRQTSKLAFKIKPFLHRLPCELSSSSETCLFEAISMISEQYKHHYYFRSLTETGNAITVVSAGKSFYTVDSTTWKMAKSNVYLTNISVIHVNLRLREPKLQVEIQQFQTTARYDKESTEKLANLLDWCIEEDAYKSPTIMNIQFADDFEMKSAIFPEDLRLQTEQERLNFQFMHYCTKKVHYINEQKPHRVICVKKQRKSVYFISAYYLTEKSLSVHNFFYDDANFQNDYDKKKRNSIINKLSETDFAAFERDLKIISNQNSHSFCHITNGSAIAKRVSSYVANAVRFAQDNQQLSKQMQFYEPNGLYQMKYLNKFYQISSLLDDDQREAKYKIKKQMSNSNTPSKDDGQSGHLLKWSGELGYSNRRKASDNLEIEMERSVDMDELDKDWRKKIGAVNIFQQTYKKKQYTPKFSSDRPTMSRLTHNKERLKKNYLDSNIHYLINQFNQSSWQQLGEFIRRPQPRTEEQKIIYQNFYVEREWKNIIFPILTPIYTNYHVIYNKTILESNIFSENQCELTIYEQIEKYLMQNFQILEDKSNNHQNNIENKICMSKGHVSLTINKNGFWVSIDEKKQERIVPRMLYRYLCYQEKDFRFGTKSLIFSDENYYTKEVKIIQKKSVKLVMLEQSTRGDGSSFKQFAKVLKQRYKVLNFDVCYNDCPSQTFSVTIDLVADLKNKIYLSEKIEVTFDVHYNPDYLYTIIVQWHYCCATYVNEFIQTIVEEAKKKNIITFMVSKNNSFNTRWTTGTIGEIIFQSKLALEILEENIVRKREWLWDRHGQYYMDRKGEAFIRFSRQKYLVEWNDNTIDKTKWKKSDKENRFYESFFMMAAAFDFLGGIIDSFTHHNPKKHSLSLSNKQST